MTRPALLLIALAIPAPARPQHVVEIDYSAGRTIIDHEWRAMNSDDAMPDWDRGRLYVRDREEPDGIMVFSLETGAHITTIRIPRGEGPFEIKDKWRRMALADDGGLHISGDRRVITYDPNYQPIRTWTPRAPPSWAICDIGGKPAVPTTGGVLRHEMETIGPSAIADTARVIDKPGRSVGEAGALLHEATGEMTLARLAFTDAMAILVRGYLRHQGENTMMSQGQPDSVFIYHRNGAVARANVPNDYVDADCQTTSTFGGRTVSLPCRPWNGRLNPSFDERGNLVLSTSHRDIAGAIIDLDTGCYTLVRKNPGTRDNILDADADMHIRMIGVRGDSILTFHNDRGTAPDGKPTFFSNSAVKAALHPVRTVSGEPCAGMLAGDENG